MVTCYGKYKPKQCVSGDDITIKDVYHWLWYGKYFFFLLSLNYTADEINTVFVRGNEIVVYPAASSTPQEKQEVRSRFQLICKLVLTYSYFQIYFFKPSK